MRQCSRNKVIVSTSGFSALLYALYAQYNSLQKTEWSFYRLSKKIAQTPAFSQSWKSELKDFIDQEFEETYFSDLKIPVVITLYQAHKKKAFYKGKIAPILKAALNIKPFNGYSFDFGQVSDLFDYSYINRLAQEKRFLINTLVLKPSFKFDRGFLWGLYSSIPKRVDQEDFKKVIKLPNKLAIDDAQNASKFFGTYVSHEQICQLLEVK